MRILIVLSALVVLSSWYIPKNPILNDSRDVVNNEDAIPGDTLVTDSLSIVFYESKDFFAQAEDSLKKLALNIVRPPEDSVRLANNQLFANYLLEVLHEEGSMQHPFDSLATISMLQPPDSGFRIITWYVPLSNQQFRYFGYLQYGDSLADAIDMPYREDSTGPSYEIETDPSHEIEADPFHDDRADVFHDDKKGVSHEYKKSPSPDKKASNLYDDNAYLYTEVANLYPYGKASVKSNKTSVIYALNEDTGFTGDVTSLEFTGSNWYGSYYYELITNQYAGEDHYVLLGWRGDNAFSRKRIVEPLSFQDGKPVFGAQVFDLDDREPYRMVFEYSARVSMGLLYDELYSRSHQENNAHDRI
jgi:hypothetical protein